MEKNNFKELYKNYKNDENKNSENALCSEVLNNCKFIVCQKEDILDAYRDENGKTVLKVYTEPSEISEYVRKQYEKIEVDFDTIWATLNNNMLDEIIINPESDRFIISNEQLNDLYRQDKFGSKIGRRRLKKVEMQEKIAYKLKDIQPLDNKVVELYKKYYSSDDENDLSEFYTELIYNATFYTRVLPENDAKLDENGNPIINYTRVLQNFIDDDGIERCYNLYLTIESLKNDGATDDMYVAEFDFDDYIHLIDKSWNIIKKIVICDLKYDINIPIDVIQELKAKKDIYTSGEDIITINGEIM